MDFRDASFADALFDLQLAMNYSTIRLHKAVGAQESVTLTASSKPIEDILREILHPRGLAYYVHNREIVIVPQNFARHNRPGYYAFREALPHVERLEVDW